MDEINVFGVISSLRDALNEIRALQNSFYYEFGSGVDDIDFTRFGEFVIKRNERRERLRELERIISKLQEADALIHAIGKESDTMKRMCRQQHVDTISQIAYIVSVEHDVSITVARAHVKEQEENLLEKERRKKRRKKGSNVHW